ncbi:cytochrome P450 [Plantactinospora solaniradicis]|uniref:Cytochrome P450 n=1 Tax=Plantactinospora solaniradicis TaxID=1723736 RepID=A0ABW1K4H6_9ACTN
MTTTSPTLPFDQPNPMEPPPAHAELRETAPVTRVRTPDGQPAWLVTSYHLVSRVLTDPRIGVAPAGAPIAGNDTLFQDGPAHGRLRRLVAKVFTPRRIATLRPAVERLAAERVAALAAAGPPADLVDLLAAPLSITVIGEMLGIAVEEREPFRRWADAAFMVDTTGPDGGFDPAAMEQAWRGLYTYMGDLIAAKRDALADDLLSDLIAVRDSDDGRLDDGELVGMAATLVSAGYLSSSNAISVGAIQLITTGRLPDLAAEPGRVEAYVEELLRRQAGLTGEAMPRWAHEEVDLDGVRVEAGDLVLVRLSGANRDPARFSDPDRFDPDRQPNPHLAFGHGPHHCLGAALARIEVGAALLALARELPDLRLARPVEEIRWSEGQVDIGPVAVPVTW